MIQFHINIGMNDYLYFINYIFQQPWPPPAAPTNSRGRRLHAEHLGAGCGVELERTDECRIGVVLVYEALTAKGAKFAKTLLH